MIITTNVAIMTDIRICARYERNATSAPIRIEPAAILFAPIHTAATVETFMTTVTVGNMRDINRPARSEVSVSSSFAFAKRCTSLGSRTKALTTRMPIICSRSTLLTVSIRSCISR